ncbi:hypothetical protein [Labilibaculum sp.]|uniref:hypothetical protein n=1 Tax=Labilibaculum sp. TaxID=2060723 RepID=UPI0035692FF3
MCALHEHDHTHRKVSKNVKYTNVQQGQAYAWSRSRMGGWAIAQSPILRTTITLERLKKRGYESMLDIYKQITPVRRDLLFPIT